MGCNIHGWVEIDRGNDKTWWVGVMPEPPLDRDYNVFTILADVRRYDKELKTISQPREHPTDISWEMEEELKQYGEDAHTKSWLTGEELLNYPWFTADIMPEWKLWLDMLRVIVNHNPKKTRFVFFFDN